MRCEVTLLGGFHVTVDGVVVGAAAWRHRRAHQLVKILALSVGHRLMAEQVIELLWPDMSASAGAANLRKAAFLARRQIGDVAALVWLERAALDAVAR